MITILNNLFLNKFLIYNLVLGDIKYRYKQAVLGILWMVMQPFATMVIFTLVFSKFAKIPSDGIPYPLFSYAGLIPWMFFANAVSRGTNNVVNQAPLIKKIYFPREVLVYSEILAASLELAIYFAMFILLMFYYKVHVTLSVLLIFPIILIEIIFITGLCLIASAFNVFLRDIRNAVPLLVQFWMFLTPVAYPLSLVPDKIKPFYMLNPMVSLIDSFREVLVKGSISDPQGLYLSTAISIVTFMIGYWVFKRLEMKFADVI
jgi:lipopolysaccharide transport system permease protein